MLTNNAAVNSSGLILPKYANVPIGLRSNMNKASKCVAFRFVSPLARFLESIVQNV